MASSLLPPSSATALKTLFGVWAQGNSVVWSFVPFEPLPVSMLEPLGGLANKLPASAVGDLPRGVNQSLCLGAGLAVRDQAPCVRRRCEANLPNFRPFETFADQLNHLRAAAIRPRIAAVTEQHDMPIYGEADCSARTVSPMAFNFFGASADQRGPSRVVRQSFKMTHCIC